MSHGAPDGVLSVEITVNAGQPAIEAAAGDAGTYTGTAQTYQDVASWTVATGKVGELKEILFYSSDYTKTVLAVLVGDVTWAIDWAPQSSLPIIFEDLRLEAGKIVKVQCKSSDGTSITVDAIIVGKEIG